MPHLLVVSHTQVESAADLTQAFIEGVSHSDIDDVEFTQRPALEATVDDVQAADALALITPANFGYMSGALKHFFDTVFNPLGESTRGRPYVLIVKGNTDTAGAIASVEKIVTGLGWKQVLPPLSVLGPVTEESREAATELGMTMAAGLEAGVF